MAKILRNRERGRRRWLIAAAVCLSLLAGWLLSLIANRALPAYRLKKEAVEPPRLTNRLL